MTDQDRQRAFKVMVYGIQQEKTLGLLTRLQFLARIEEASDICFSKAVKHD
jgi:hypothetical protein